MKKRFFILSFMAMAIMMLFSSCTKDEPETKIKENAVTYDGKTYEVARCSFDYDYDDANHIDWVEIDFYDSDDNSILYIECAYSHNGQKIDLTQLDPYANSWQYKYYIYPDFGADWELWGGTEDTELADEGYLTFTHSGSNYSVEVYAVINGKVLTAQYTGKTN